MDVIIVSKTHMYSAACVGGVLANGKFVRILDEKGYNQPENTDYEIGDVWSIEYIEQEERRPPHVEDILVSNCIFKFKFSTQQRMVEHLIEKLKIKIWKGAIEKLFDGKLQWTSGGSGYISENGEIPENSVGFWISDKNLTRRDYNEKIRYSYPFIQDTVDVGGLEVSGQRQWRNIPFVGFQEPVNKIPAGTLVRVSLARWWTPGEDEERCYLQLSGWYCIP